MQRILAIVVTISLLFTGCSSSRQSNPNSNDVSIRQIKVTDDYKNFNDYIAGDELSKYVFSWEKDLGKNKEETTKMLGEHGFNFAVDRLFSGDKTIWWISLAKFVGFDEKISGKNQLVEKIMKPAIEEILKPDSEEMAAIELLMHDRYKQHSKWIEEMDAKYDDFYDSFYTVKEKGAADSDLVKAGVDTTVEGLKAFRERYKSVGAASSDIAEIEKQLDYFSFWKHYLEKWNKSALLQLTDVGLWSVDKLYKASALAYTQNSRAVELRQFISGGLDTNNIWENAMILVGNDVLKFYESKNLNDKLQEVMIQDAPEKGGELLASAMPVISRAFWLKTAVDIGKLGILGDVFKSSELMMQALGTEGILKSSLRQYYKTLDEIKKNPNGATPQQLEKLKLSGLLALRASVQERRLIIKSYESLGSSNYQAAIKQLQSRNDETIGMIARWVTRAENTKISSAALTLDYFIPTNLKATYHFLTTGKNIVSVDKDGINYDLTWKKIGPDTYESKAIEMFSGEFTERFVVKPDRISWIYGEDAYYESEKYNPIITKGERIEFLLKNIGAKWTNDYVVKTEVIEGVETDHFVVQCQVLGPEKIELKGKQKEAIKVVRKTEKMTTEEWYVKGLGLVKTLYTSSDGTITKELVGITEGDKMLY